MKAVRGDYIRRLGCLRMHIDRLNKSLRNNSFDGMEEESREVQDLLLELIKLQRKLGRADLIALRPRFAVIRQEALQSLEVSRRILDDSLQAMLELVKAVQDATGYGVGSRGPSVMVDRKA